jgi:hypothetical protein
MLRRPVLLALAVAGVIAAVAVGLTSAAFVGTTSNAGDSFTTGTVSITDNDAGGSMLALSAAKPGNSDTSCIKVTYTGSLDSTVRLYAAAASPLAPFLQLTVTRGTDSSPSFDACTNFTSDATNYIGSGAGVIYSGLLSAYPATYGSGIVDPVSGSPETWTTSEVHSYKFVVSLINNPAAQGLSATATFTWEARNL